ncbi:MAG: hypothetical protein AAGC60_04435 [Acidobacteriota bacterium]
MRIEIEWVDGEGIADPILAQTYCRLEWRIGDRVVTRAASGPSRSLVEGVHVSVFPLFEWMVENWWFLLAEPSLVEEGRRTGRDLARNRRIADWMKRHSLLAAQEGWIYPDLRFSWDDGRIAARWSSDPEVLGSEGSRLVQYLSDGWAQLDYDETVSELQRFGSSVIDRLSQSKIAADLSIDREWREILATSGREEVVNRSLAALGFDPYDPADEIDRLAGEIEAILGGIQSRVAQDFFTASDQHSFEKDRCLIDAVVEQAETEPSSGRSPFATDSLNGSTPFERGYSHARQYRDQLGLDSLVESEQFGTLEESSGRRFELRTRSLPVGGATLRAAVERPNGRYATIFSPIYRDVPTDRFVKACSVYHLLATVDEGEMRLVTSAKTSDQAAARAFAAEFLAPSSLLRSEISANPEPREIDCLAEKYQVSSRVIEYQVQNHGLGELAVA